MTKHGNPEIIKKTCEWTGKEFEVDWKHRNKRFVNKEAMYAWRKNQNREFVKCLTCSKMFERYKRILHYRSKKPTQYCSNQCSQKSDEKKERLRKWIENNNPMNDPSAIEKIRLTKLIKFGDSNYNNFLKQQETMFKKYGVSCYFDLPNCKSNGRRISKFQKQKYKEIRKIHPDAELEKYLSNVKRAVDIFIPSLNKVIECHGSYWHCNPLIYSPDYYNKMVHLTAKEIWERDEEKKKLLETHGFNVEIYWESI